MSGPGDQERQDRADDQPSGGVSRRALLGSAAAGGLAAALLQASRASGAAAATSAQVDQLGGALFALEVEGITGFFTEVSGLGSETEVIDQKPTTRVPGQLHLSDIVLKRGVTANRDLYDWRKLQEESGVGEVVGKDGAVILFDETQTEVARWNFINAWPSKLTVGNAKLLSDDVIIVEEFVLIPDSYQRVK